MIKLEDFLSNDTNIHTIQAVRKKVYNLRHDSTPMVWVYDGYDSFNEQYKDDNLLCVFRSAYVPRIILPVAHSADPIPPHELPRIVEDLLSKNVVEIYVMPDGIAVCVSDK